MDQLCDQAPSRPAITYAINHVFLPPKLPNSGDDSSSTIHDKALLKATSNALQRFQGLVDPNVKKHIKLAHDAIQRFDNLINKHGFLPETQLQHALKHLIQNGGFLPLYIKAQNAAILISCKEDSLLFYFFELSPNNEAIIGTKGRLRRCFPASALSIKIATLMQDGCLSSLAHTVAKLSCQEVAEAKARVRKKGDLQIEERDTTNPRLVTDFLLTVLSSMGKCVKPARIWKNTREEVLWSNSLLPWRRSPVWLLARVTIQTIMTQPILNKNAYKHFMLFFMADIMQAAQPYNKPSGVIYCMAAKVSRRLLKLNGDVNYPWLQAVEKAISVTRSCIETRWKSAIKQVDPPLDIQCLSIPQLNECVRASYPRLDKYIQEIESRLSIEANENFQSKWSFPPAFDPKVLPSIQEGLSGEVIFFNLLEFEQWVCQHLDSWLNLHISNIETCDQLYITMENYHRIAIAQYSGSPENLSIMLLTIMELWIACDKSACKIHNILPEYNHEVPFELVQSLILPSKDQMVRLNTLEVYIRARRHAAKSFNPSVLSSFGDKTAFSVRYAESSQEHQELLLRIEQEASHEREMKGVEFRQLSLEYQRLMDEYNSKACSYEDCVDDSTGIFRQIHSAHCRRCSSQRTAEGLSIAVHEWPLPKDKSEALSVVFELEVPQSFNGWRNATTYLLNKVFGFVYDDDQAKGNFEWKLERYLPKYHRSFDRRIVLLSTAKPNRGTHRKEKYISTAKETDVLLENGLCLLYYDNALECFVSTLEESMEIPQICTYQLSKQCNSLQEYLFRPFGKSNGLTPNDVISQQSSCPDHLSIEEFKAMATLPMGYRIQWSNILTQLNASIVNFSKFDTVLMLLQISGQAGPPAKRSVYRASHLQLQDKTFVQKFLDSLTRYLEMIKENWESYHSLGAFIILANRILTLSSAPTTTSKCLNFLHQCRKLALEWLSKLQTKVKNSENAVERAEFLVLSFEVAHICISSFDVDEHNLRELLQNPEKASILIEASVVIQTRVQSALQQNDPFHRYANLRWKRIMYKAYRLLSQEIVEKQNPCLNLGIQESWSAYPGVEEWNPVSTGGNHHWLVGNTSASSGSGSLQIHFNLLTSELLVNGRPLSRLPSDYESCHQYRTLFGRVTLEVLPTNVPGMQFSAKERYHGYSLYFGKNNLDPNEILVLAAQDSINFDHIPPRVFEGRLPDHFISDYTHWYKHKDKSVEFRLKRNAWESSTLNWTMSKLQSSWILRKESLSLVLAESTTAKSLALIERIEDWPYTHFIFNAASSKLDIEMPRLKIGFSLWPNSKKLLSQQFKDMYVDPEQIVGSLVGLRSKLVLKNDFGRRKVLVPNGAVSCDFIDGHAVVDIEKATSNRIHPYDVDELLGRLVDNGSLQSKLTLCYLHALTSYCIPDPLTRKTGTEMALSILESAAVRSFSCLSRENHDMLNSIAELSPRRAYYPAELQVMERVTWNPSSSFLSQHGRFYTAVHSILARNSATKFFYPEIYIEPEKPKHVNEKLWERHSIRTSAFQVSGFGAESHTNAFDKTYKQRDNPLHLDQSRRVFEVSTMIFENRQTLFQRPSFNLADQLYQLLNSSESTQGPNTHTSMNIIEYDSRWLDDLPSALRSYWCSLHQILGGSSPPSKFHILMCLATIAYSENENCQAALTLAAISNIRSLGQIKVPDEACFPLSNGYVLERSLLQDATRRHLVPFRDCPESTIPSNRWESWHQLQNRRHGEFQAKQNEVVRAYVDAIQRQWVCSTPEAPTDQNSITYIVISAAATEIRSIWNSCYCNHLFYEYLKSLATALQQCLLSSITPLGKEDDINRIDNQRARPSFISNKDVFYPYNPEFPDFKDLNCNLFSPASSADKVQINSITLLAKRLEEQALHRHENNYVQDLRESGSYLKTHQSHSPIQRTAEELKEYLRDFKTCCQARIDDIYLNLKKAIEVNCKNFVVQESSSEEQNTYTFMAPRISPIFFLQQLARKNWKELPQTWKKAIVTYAIALTKLQQAERLDRLQHDEMSLLKESLNLPHSNWNPFDYPESLLLEVENGILIREVQEHIASQMRNPSNNANSVMQLNMGEGKSSVIVPIVAANLANGTKLVRVIAAKPQMKELFRMLVLKLGGLLNHQIYHMPFSRSLKLTTSDALGVQQILTDCMNKGGILLVQPEHILSFKLMGIECQATGRDEIGNTLLGTQHFLNLHSRDIVDESDENFSTKFELVYTMGTQRPIELSPERWTLLQRVLTIFASLVAQVRDKLPESIEVSHLSPGRFPRTRFLRQDAQDLLLGNLAETICKEGLPGFPIGRESRSVRLSVCKYISEAQLLADQVASTENNLTFISHSTKGPLLLLRGLIAEGVFAFTFSHKRWRVNYGLTSTRQPSTRLAVPYRAKDCPTPRSEFSHPDVVIVLTCLCYYYEGLSDDDLFLAFERLLKSDQANLEYNEWVNDAPELPSAFGQLAGVNMKDRFQAIHKIFPHLRFAKSVIDYFLAHIVFPKEVKEFPHKLSASGWDLGEKKANPTTGFSGTIDSRHLLPLNVEYLDLKEQRHTNALVLDYLHRPENTVAYLPQPKDIKCTDAKALLDLVLSMDPRVQVILDVGAQVLELKNKEVAQIWLELLSDDLSKEAVVFFDDNDDLCVVDRKGNVELLQISPYSERLDLCLVFLDEAHTRGTDLKLAKNYRAAVTLGANLTKDRLVQACMRMRELGKGQSVVFCIPDEIRSKISIASRRSVHEICVSDVLLWAILESHANIRQSMPLWAVQGERYLRHAEIWAESTSPGGIQMSESQAERFLEDEAQSLETRYKPIVATSEPSHPFSNIERASPHLNAIRERCKDFDSLQFKASTLQEEQERELSPEIEQERQVERPAPADPLPHNLHPDIRSFVKTGILALESKAIVTAFQTIENTSAAKLFKLGKLPADILATVDYMKTVELRGSQLCSDQYQRPIQWILTGREEGCIFAKIVLIVSPHEAQELMSIMKDSKLVHLHVYSALINPSFPPLDDLRLYTVPSLPENWQLPRHLRLQLNLFTGQLYFTSFRDYAETCEMLGLAYKADDSESSSAQGSGSRSMLQFLKVLLTRVRRDCSSIDRTHWGKIIGGELLTESDFVRSEHANEVDTL
ncbi:MAG: hypothetical protein M1829_000681 [Trizodia sp. TS-e1964]|nr:MAG: hypothetical protein M1829_000681 [Trizodia sp. TS-e1964]